MAKFSIGETKSGKAIVVDTEAKKGFGISEIFHDFNDYDIFDALLVVEYLILCETRRTTNGLSWIDALHYTRFHLSRLLGSKVDVIKSQLRINSAFAARDYGRRLIYAHLRM